MYSFVSLAFAIPTVTHFAYETANGVGIALRVTLRPFALIFFSSRYAQIKWKQLFFNYTTRIRCKRRERNRIDDVFAKLVLCKLKDMKAFATTSLK